MTNHYEIKMCCFMIMFASLTFRMILILNQDASAFGEYMNPALLLTIKLSPLTMPALEVQDA